MQKIPYVWTEIYFSYRRQKKSALQAQQAPSAPTPNEPVVITRAPQHNGLQVRSLRATRIATRPRRRSAKRPGREGRQGRRISRGLILKPGVAGVRQGCRGDRLLPIILSCGEREARSRRRHPRRQRGGRGAAAAGSGGGMSDAETAGATSPVTWATHASLTAGTGREPSATAVRSRPARFRGTAEGGEEREGGGGGASRHSAR